MPKFETDRSVRTITNLPGNINLAVSHGMYMKPEFRGKGFAHEEQQQSLDFMRSYGYKYALCTVAGDNEAQIKVLNKAGWVKLASFWDDCMCHDVFLFGKDLQQ